MGVMETPLAVREPMPLVFTPHPITLEGQQYIPAELREGETLGAFLGRTIDLGADAWEVKVGGVVVPVAMWDRVKPKHGHLIEVRGAVKKQALYIVAMLALTYFTMGAGAAWAGALGATGFAATAVYAAAFIAGSIVINKVLGPKPPEVTSRDRESVYNIGSARNAIRPHEPLGLLFGRTRIAPDVISQPYSYYAGNDQYVAMVLSPGINVDRFDELYFGDTPLSSYQGVTVYQSGFPGMPDQDIPIHSNADTVAGGELTSAGGWITRTTSPDTVQVMVNIEYLLFGVGTSGKAYSVAERVDIEYRPAGTSAGWMPLNQRRYVSKKQDPRRDTIQGLLPRGQWDIRVRIAGLGDYTGDNTQENRFTWTTLVSVQADDADYRGIPRIGVLIKATGQLNGAPDQIRADMYQKSMPFWTGTAWVPATGDRLSNPGALILQYARGYFDPDGNLIAGMGLPESMIDAASFQAFMRHCEVNGYTYDFWLQSPRSHREVRDSIALAGFGQTTWAGGRLSVAWAAQGQPLTGVVNMATIKKGEFEVDYTLVSAADGIEYSYFDRDTQQLETLRVPAPGVVTMLNPARMTGEGISTEAHAAEMARYHLAQHLYQFKSIGYSTDLEHMTYKRLSVLALSHDMTKWGRSGRVVSVSLAGLVVTVELDEPVAAPTTGKAYIGLRIPGERVYRVFEVAPFTGESDTLVLADPWPTDAALPGETADNPAHDTIWIYDFQSTPGYRVRVTSIEPESGLKGARISCVPEGPEFWTYVKTGHYEPPVQLPPSNSRPAASNLAISENQVLVGSGEYTELTATFDLSGRAAYSVVYAARLPDGILEEVAQTSTRTASWQIPEAGEYAVEVRPFDDEGNAGESVTGTYITSRADTPPPVFDLFEVQSHPGGIREYWWGYYGATMQAANLAGAEIRYIAGNFPSPSWEAMTPLGEGDGFFASAVQTVTPPAGQWTFAIRARNTSGILSTGMTVIVRTLTGNLGELVGGIDQQLIDQQAAIDQAAYDAAMAQAAAAEALALNGRPWDAVTAWQVGDVVSRAGRMYRALQASTNVEPPNAPYWDDIGAVTESFGTTTQALTQLRTDVDDQGQEFAAAITQVRAGSSSKVMDPSFEAGGWIGTSQFQVSLPSFDARTGTKSLRIGGSRGFRAYVQNDHEAIVSPGDRLTVGYWLRTSGSVPSAGATVWLGLRYTTADGTYVDWPGAAFYTSNGVDAFGYRLFSEEVVVPPGAERLTVYIIAEDWSSGFVHVDDVFATSVSGGEQANATATFALQAAQDAQITLTTNVNGHVSGMYSKNDGQRGVISFLADVFEIIASGSIGVQFTKRNGGYFMRFYASAIQCILGINFGASNNLCFWYGSNVGEANCHKGNGTIWFDNSGAAYFRGAIIAGTIRNGGYSSSQLPAVTFSTGTFSTTGNPISVNASYAFQQVHQASADSSVITAGSGSTQATLQLWRSLAGGAWNLVGSQTVTGTLDITNVTDGASVAVFSMSGAITFLDNAGGLDTRNYEVRMFGRQTQSLNVTGGVIDLVTTDQATGVTTGEN